MLTSSILESSISFRSGYGKSRISRLGASSFHGAAVILLFWKVGRIPTTFGIRASGSDLFQWSVGRRIRGYTRLHQIPGVISILFLLLVFHQPFIFYIYPQSPSSTSNGLLFTLDVTTTINLYLLSFFVIKLL